MALGMTGAALCKENFFFLYTLTTVKSFKGYILSLTFIGEKTGDAFGTDCFLVEFSVAGNTQYIDLFPINTVLF